MKTMVRWWWVAVGAVAGIVLGGYLAFRFTSAFLMDGYHAALVANTKVSLEVLRDLRSGDSPKAIRSLEREMDANLSFLSASMGDAAKLRAAEIEEIVDQVSEYRQTDPSSGNSAATPPPAATK